MAVLASCWLIIESTVICHGFFRRWFYLSSISTLSSSLLPQILLCLKWLNRCILALLIYPYRIFSFLVFCVYRFVHVSSSSLLSRVKEDDDDSYVEAADSFVKISLSDSVFSSSIPSIELKAELVEPQREPTSVRLFFCCSSPLIDESYLNEYSPLFSSSNSPLMKASPLPARLGLSSFDREMIATARDDDESEVFYQKYSERMRWFDVLNHDRTQGIGAILNMEMGSPSSLEKIKLKDLTIPPCIISTEKSSSCASPHCFFAHGLAKDFETFQLLLERFLDEEKYKGKRAWNYVQARHASKTLLQVPKITGYLEEEKEGETVDGKDVLKAIEKCIKAFGKFITMERNKAWWKLKSSLGTYPPMENPRDLQLLADLTTTLGRKEVWLKDLQGKQRVLQMSMVSSSQLNWCQQKLNNIQFQRGRLFRTATGPLFPSS
ncbi:hypothetical protein GQ457_HM001760 [Hibiscus cannabinus]